MKGKKIKYNDYVERKKQSSKYKCNKCKRISRVRNIIYFKGKFLCNKCISKLPTFRNQLSACTIGMPHITFEKAINKIYEPKIYNYKNGTQVASIHLPIILSGHKFKLQLVE